MRAKSCLDRSVGTAPLRADWTSDRELLATTGAPCGEHPAATLALHARAETVLLRAMALLGLIGLLGHLGIEAPLGKRPSVC